MRASRCLIVGMLLAAACSSRSEDASVNEGALAGGAEPTLSPAVSTEAVTGPSYSFQYRPVIASGGGAFLAAWLDRDVAGKSARVRAARVDASGDVAGGPSITLPSAGPGDDGEPAIAFDGTSFLVVWSHGAPPATPGSSPPESVVLAARIALDGTLLSTQPIELGKTPGKHAAMPSVAWNGTEYLVAWFDDRDPKPEIYAARLGADGAPIGSASGFRVSSTGGDGGKTPSVTAAGRTFFVAWDEMGSMMRIRGARVLEGAVVDATALTIASGGTHAYMPSAASDGTDFFVAWYDYFHSGPNSVKAARISGTGELVSGAISVGTAQAGRPAAIWDGEGYAVAWSGGAKRFTKDGAALPTQLPGTSSSEEGRPAIGWNGASYLVLRTQRTSAALQGQVRNVVSGALYAKTGGAPIRAAIAVARADAPQRQAASAFDGANHLVVWQEFRTDWEHPEIWGALYKPDGTLVDPKGFKLRGSETLPSKPVVAFDGNDYVVAWEERGANNYIKVATTRVAKTGPGAEAPSVIDGTKPSLVTAGAGKVLLLANDRAYVVPAAGAIDPARPLFVRGDETGWTLGTTAPVVFDGTRFVLAWTAYKGGTSTAEVHALRFSQAGQKLDTRPIVVSSANISSAIPAITAASDGKGQTLIAWEDRSINTGSIVGTRLDGNGNVLGGTVRLDAAATPAKAFAPAVAFDGHNWLVAYESREDGSRTEGGSALALSRFRFLTNGFDRLGSLAIASEGGWSPALAPSAMGKALLTYESIGSSFGSPGRAAIRLFGDVAGPTVTPPGPGPGTTSGSPPTTGDDDDDDDTGVPTSSGGAAPKNPNRPTTTPTPTKGATIKPIEGAGAPPAEEGGCSVSTRSRSDATGAFLLVAIGAALVGRRRRFS